MGIIKNIITKLYGARMRFSRLTGLGVGISDNEKKVAPPESFYNLYATANNGDIVTFDKFRGKSVLLVNLASQCGYTPQYNDLEQLYQLNKNKLVVLGFPSNDFGGQEPGSDEEISTFCKVNFGVTFPLFQKNQVKGNNKQPVYQWLCSATRNGWNDEEPSWNFYKYLVDEQGYLVKTGSSSVEPVKMMG